jgi:hypothetical protein
MARRTKQEHISAALLDQGFGSEPIRALFGSGGDRHRGQSIVDGCLNMSLNEYQNNADECLRWAAEARNERHRQIYVEMAKAWMLAARLAGPVAASERNGPPLAGKRITNS